MGEGVGVDRGRGVGRGTENGGKRNKRREETDSEGSCLTLKIQILSVVPRRLNVTCIYMYIHKVHVQDNNTELMCGSTKKLSGIHKVSLGGGAKNTRLSMSV